MTDWLTDYACPICFHMTNDYVDSDDDDGDDDDDDNNNHVWWQRRGCWGCQKASYVYNE